MTKSITANGKVPSKSYRLLFNVIVGTIVMFTTIILAILIFTVVPLISDTSIFKIFSNQDSEWPYYVTAVALLFSLLILSSLYVRRNLHELSESIDKFINKSDLTSYESITSKDEDFLNYLDEGEKRIYLLLKDSGGSLLQKDLIGVNGYSAATISRILDKLERKGLIEKIRFGSTYKIILKSNFK